ncbi:hypothetical protein LTR27_002132 [Elasticomyces elasticus]|nr:hypothetical protein LTR27_002132 [Elasticomyces elasticus]
MDHWTACALQNEDDWVTVKCSTSTTAAYGNRPPSGDFMAYTLSYGIKAYLQARLTQEPGFLQESTVPYLFYALRRPWYATGECWSRADSKAHLDIVRYMLKHGADPNTVITSSRSPDGFDRTVLRAYLDQAGDEEADDCREIEVFFNMIQAEAQTIGRGRTDALIPNIVRDAVLWIWDTQMPAWGIAPVMQLKRLVSQLW